MSSAPIAAPPTARRVPIGTRWYVPVNEGALADAIRDGRAEGQTIRTGHANLKPRPWDAILAPPNGQPVGGALAFGTASTEPGDQIAGRARAYLTIELAIPDARPTAYALVDLELALALSNARKREGLTERDTAALDELDRVWPLIQQLGPCPEGTDRPFWDWHEEFSELSAVCWLAAYPMATPRWLTRLADALNERVQARGAGGQPTRHRLWAFEQAVASEVDDEEARERVLDVLALQWLLRFQAERGA